MTGLVWYRCYEAWFFYGVLLLWDDQKCQDFIVIWKSGRILRSTRNEQRARSRRCRRRRCKQRLVWNGLHQHASVRWKWSTLSAESYSGSCKWLFVAMDQLEEYVSHPTRVRRREGLEVFELSHWWTMYSQYLTNFTSFLSIFHYPSYLPRREKCFT